MANLKELIVNGVSHFIGKVFINDSQINTINGVTVGSTPKFTDTTALGSMTGTLGVDHGGTGKTTGKDAANYFMNALDTGSSTPADGDYYISQYVNGGTSTTTYHRRPMSALWTYVKDKIDANGGYTNKNVFGKVKVGSTTVEADTTQDTLELVAGSNVTLTPDATNDKVTIASSDYSYIRTEGDNRSVATSPSDYTSSGGRANKLAFRGLKNNSYINNPSSDTYSYLVGLRGWSDDSGGNAHELAFNNSGIYARNGSSSTWGNWGKIYTSENLTYDGINPLQTKTYTDVIATANNEADGQLYCMKVQPDNYGSLWSITYRVTATIAGVSVANGSGYETSIVYLSGMRDTYSSYRTWNDIAHSSYRPYYYHCFYRAKEAGITGGYGHMLGINLRYSYNPTTTANARTVKFEILGATGCTVTFLDAPTKYANFSGTGTTNYNTYTNFDATTYGNTMSGDRNDVNYYNRNYYGCRTTATALYRYQLCLTKPDRSLVPINTVNNSIATNKTLTSESFDPFGDILYWASTTTYSAGANVGDGWYAQYLADIRYSFNIGGYNTESALIGRKPLYLVAYIQEDGTAVLADTEMPLTQELPDEDYGVVYIYLGQVYPDTYPYRLYMSIYHPVYQVKNGRIQLYTPSDINNLIDGTTTGSVKGVNTLAEGTQIREWDVNQETWVNYTYYIGTNGFAEGSNTQARGNTSHAEGDSTIAGGISSHAEGNATIARGYAAHAEGYNPSGPGQRQGASGDYSHSEGAYTTASGEASHAEGNTTIASGMSSHAEGQVTTASGGFSHSEGGYTEASGNYSHAEGRTTEASGDNSHSEGYETTANHRSQHVFGEYNAADTSPAQSSARGNYVEIVGKGTADNARSNARTLDWSGNEVLAGKLTVGANPIANMDVVTKQYMENKGYLTLATLPIWNGTVT